MEDYIIQILATVITAVASFIGLQVKNAYTKYVDTKTKKEIVKSTVEYIEQVASTYEWDNAQKRDEAIAKASDWLTSKGIKVTATEIYMLVESAVNGLKQGGVE